MLEGISVSEEINKIVKDIIAKYDLEPISNIKYYPVAEKGDGFASKTVGVEINGKKTLELFIKYALKIIPDHIMPINKMYLNEVYFYNFIYPEYVEFLKEHQAEDLFNNVPKFYGTTTKNIIALENLKKKDFVLFKKSSYMNDNHLSFVLKTLAKFQAISFAYKDQKRQKYFEMVNKTVDFYSIAGKSSGFYFVVKTTIERFLNKLDVVKDKHILEACNPETLAKVIFEVDKTIDEYSILTQGDFWCNNIMFKYNSKTENTPTDLMLIDWQHVRPSSPVYDISLFLYTIASKETLSNLSHYLQIYHKELHKSIKQLGSDPNIIYPYSILEKEWKKYGKYGFALAFIVIRMMLSSKDEILDFEDIDFENIESNNEKTFCEIEKEDEYHARLKILAEHLVKNEFL